MSRRRCIVLNKPVASLCDRGGRQRRADEDDERFVETNIDNRRIVCPRSQEERFRAWQSMRKYVENYKHRDFDQIWLGLCQDDPDAKLVIRSYFRDYVENSQMIRPVLGEQEYQSIQTITCTKTVIAHWKNLVGEADNTILRFMREKEPANRTLWKLRWDKGDQTDRPVADISNWIRKDLASMFGLIRETQLTFVKVETTAEDLLLLLDTLWTRGEDVPCRPQVRFSILFYPGNSFSRHVNKEHGNLFEEPFECHECQRHGTKVVIELRGWSTWRRYIGWMVRQGLRFQSEFPRREKGLARKGIGRLRSTQG